MAETVHFVKVVGGKKYDTTKATLLASDRYWDGSNWERGGRNGYLYRTANGRFFVVNTTLWQGERDELRPVSEAEAVELFETSLTEHECSWQEAFPSRELQEA